MTEELSQSTNLIYIPICFYYFEDVIENSMCDEEFTFQYVSIISCIA